MSSIDTVVSRHMAAQQVTVSEEAGLIIVRGPYEAMKNIYPKLKGQGFYYDGQDRSWRMPISKMTPGKRKNFDKLLEPWLGKVVLSEKEREAQEMRRRNVEGLSIQVPYEKGDEARSRGGIWSSALKAWLMPDKESLAEVRKALSGYRTEAQRLADEMDRRVKEHLGVNIVYELKDKARAMGGIWHKTYHMWLMPDKESKDKIKAESDALDRKEISKGRTISFPGRHRGDAPPVGYTFRTRDGDVVTVTKVTSRYYREDGLSFGLPDDEGWMHYVEVRDATEAETADALRAETEKKSGAEAMARVKEIRGMLLKRENYPSGMHEVRGDRLLIDGGNTILYGGGSWFLLDAPRYIWFIRNNGADGDNWSHSNVNHSTIGWRIPYDEVLAEELLGLHKVLGNH